MKTWQKILIFFTLLLGLTIRVYHLSNVPASLFYDEIDLGYQARSLLANWRDYRGERSPFYVHSFNTDKTPLPAYITTITTFLVPTKEELQVRLPSAILGTISIGLLILIVWNWQQKFWPAFWTGIITSTSPWQIQFSRIGFETIYMQTLYLLGIYLWFYWIKSKKFKYHLLSIFFISLTVYTYRPMSLYALITFFGLAIIFSKQLIALKLKKLLLSTIIIASLIIPFLYKTTISAVDQPRINQISITSDASTPIWVQRDRELDSGDLTNATLGKSAVWWSFIFHNKLVSWGDAFLNNYLHSFSPDFLFTKGDPNWRHGVNKMGPVLTANLFALLIGIGYLVTQIRQSKYQWWLYWLITASIPSALTQNGGNHASRLFILSAPLIIAISLGWWKIFTLTSIKSIPFFTKLSSLPTLKLTKLKSHHRIKPQEFIPIIILLIWIANLTFYLHRYFVHYPIDSARDFGYGYKQAVRSIRKIESQYQQIQLTTTKDPPILYYLFWNHINPIEVQKYGTKFDISVKRNLPLDKYKRLEWDSQLGKKWTTQIQPNILYLVSQNEIPLDWRSPAKDPIPQQIKLIDTILYPDQEVAFYILSKQPDTTPKNNK